MNHKNAFLLGLSIATLTLLLTIFYDFVIDDSLQRTKLSYLVLFIGNFIIDYAIAFFALKNMKKK